MSQTAHERLALDRLRDARERVELRDAVIGFVAFVGLVGALATMPWWLS